MLGHLRRAGDDFINRLAKAAQQFPIEGIRHNEVTQLPVLFDL
jgi:hypothetical protein